MKLQLHTDEQIELANKAFASGGEGELFRILRPSKYRSSVVKYYKPSFQTSNRAQKIDYLLRHSPNIQAYKGHHSLIWIQQKVFDTAGKFVGFMMPLAEGISLEKLCHPKLPKSLPMIWRKFDFKQKNILQLRLKICFNIAAALYQIHQTEHYVLVDMKPENILIKPNGLISIIDIDSVEVIEKGQVLFPASVATPDYTPPEYIQSSSATKKNIPKTPQGDAFSLAVIFYRLLIGIHPFTGTCRKPYDRLETLAEMIEHGLYPHSPKWQNYFEVVPPPHQKFHQLPSPVKKLFLQCFEVGFKRPKLRPSANDWCNALALPKQKSPVASRPSNLIPLPKWTASKALSLKTPVYSLPKIDILQLQSLPSLRSPKNHQERVFQQRLKRNFQQQLQYLKGMIHNLQNYYKEYDKIQKSFAAKQNQILANEKKAFDKMLQSLQKQIQQADKKGLQLAEKEAQERQKYHEQFAKKSTELLQKIQWQELMLQALRHRDTRLLQQQLQKIKKYAQEQSQLIEMESIQAISALQNDWQQQKNKQLQQLAEQSRKKLKKLQQKKQKIQKEQKAALTLASQTQVNPLTQKWLQSYKVKTHVNQIFTDKYAKKPVLIAQLARFGIHSAADFVKAHSNGKLLLVNGKWVKVPKVGLKRAKSLERWRGKLLKQMPLNIHRILPNQGQAVIHRKFAPQFHSIEQAIVQENKQANQKRQNAITNFERKKQTLNQKIDRLKKQAKTKRNQLLQNTQKEIQTLREQFQKLAKSYSTQPQKTIQQIKTRLEKLKKERSKNQESARKKQQQIGSKYQKDHQNHLLQLKQLRQLSQQGSKQNTLQQLQQNLHQHHSRMEYAKSHQKQLEELVLKKLEEVHELRRLLV